MKRCAAYFLLLSFAVCALEDEQPAIVVPVPPDIVIRTQLPDAPGRREAGEAEAAIVPLPPEAPKNVPKENLDPEKIFFTLDRTFYKPREIVAISVYGPELLVRQTQVEYILEDTFQRQFARGILQLANLRFAEGKPRQIRLAAPDLPHLRTAGRFDRYTLRLLFNEEETKLEFSVLPPRARGEWEGLLALTSIPPAPDQWRTLRSFGISGAIQFGANETLSDNFQRGNCTFFSENAAGNLLQTSGAQWTELIETINPRRGEAIAWQREPSIYSAAMKSKISEELAKNSAASASTPLFYSLASEPSLTRLCAAADFDFSPEAMQEFQRWLERDVYGTLPGLNLAWETQHTAWRECIPITTDEALARMKSGNGSFASWMDFREFQDYRFSKTFADAANELKKLRPTARVGITGAVGAFAFGGWNWSRLSQSLDVVETYDIASARALWRDLAPQKPAFATLKVKAATDPQAAALEAQRLLWPFVLEGGPRGVIFWQTGTNAAENPETVWLVDGQPSPLADAMRLVLSPLQNGPGVLLAHSERADDGVAVLYSPASIRLHWLREAAELHGDDWLLKWGADTAAERRESKYLRLRESWQKLLDDLGISWRFVSTEQLEGDFLIQKKFKAIVLPRILALNEKEAAALKKFAEKGGQIIADSAFGEFDAHGRRQKIEIAGSSRLNLDATDYLRWRLHPEFPRAREARAEIRNSTLGRVLDNGLIDWAATSLPPGTQIVRLHPAESDCVLLALRRNFQTRLHELGTEADGNWALEKPEKFSVVLKKKFHATNIFAGSSSETANLNGTLDPLTPSIYALSPVAPQPLRITAPKSVRLQERARLEISTHDETAAVFEIRVFGPNGHDEQIFADSIYCPAGNLFHDIVFSLNDPAGLWTIRIRDVLSGVEAKAEVKLEKPQN